MFSLGYTLYQAIIQDAVTRDLPFGILLLTNKTKEVVAKINANVKVYSVFFMAHFIYKIFAVSKCAIYSTTHAIITRETPYVRRIAEICRNSRMEEYSCQRKYACDCVASFF